LLRCPQMSFFPDVCLRVLVVFVCVFASTLVGAAEDASEVKHVLLLSQSPDGHPASTHEYAAGMNLLKATLASIPGIEVTHVNADSPWPAGPELIRDADCVAMFISEGARWIHQDPRRIEAFAQLAARGGGLITWHWAMGTKDARYIDGYLKLFGGCHGGPDRKYQVLDADVSIAERDHPITQGIRPFSVHEEFYYALKFVTDSKQLQPILTIEIDGSSETVAWAWQRGDGGRSFGFSGGHFHANWKREEYRRLMTQAVLWSLDIAIPEGGVNVEIAADALQLPAE
jgi:type 1 glutamine amidotransferase